MNTESKLNQIVNTYAPCLQYMTASQLAGAIERKGFSSKFAEKIARLAEIKHQENN